MPSLAFELEQLLLADEHIARAEVHIRDMRHALAKEVRDGLSTAASEAVLAVTEDSLSAFREHRALIVETIADIRAGRLPDLDRGNA